MRRHEWFKRWRHDDGTSEQPVPSGGRRGSGPASLMHRIWPKRLKRKQRTDATEAAAFKQVSPFSHGLF